MKTATLRIAAHTLPKPAFGRIPFAKFRVEQGTPSDYENGRQDCEPVTLKELVELLAHNWPTLQYGPDPLGGHHTFTYATASYDPVHNPGTDPLLMVCRADGSPLDKKMTRWLRDRVELYRIDFAFND